MIDPAPLILTLMLDPDAQARFDRLRSTHFPPERNVLVAHVTLFHALPPACVQVVTADLEDVSRGTTGFDIDVTGLFSLGRGTAYRLQSAELMGLRAELAGRWAAQLGAQDRQGFRPHVTVQNKVTPVAAKQLLGLLSAGFAPFTIGARGFALWRYRGGPWEAAGEFEFKVPQGHPPEHRRR